MAISHDGYIDHVQGLGLKILLLGGTAFEGGVAKFAPCLCGFPACWTRWTSGLTHNGSSYVLMSFKDFSGLNKLQLRTIKKKIYLSYDPSPSALLWRLQQLHFLVVYLNQKQIMNAAYLHKSPSTVNRDPIAGLNGDISHPTNNMDMSRLSLWVTLKTRSIRSSLPLHVSSSSFLSFLATHLNFLFLHVFARSVPAVKNPSFKAAELIHELHFKFSPLPFRLHNLVLQYLVTENRKGIRKA